MATKPTLQEKILQKSDRELMQDIAYFAHENEKHLRRISLNVQFFFWFFLIVGFIYAFMMFIAAGQHPVYPYR